MMNAGKSARDRPETAWQRVWREWIRPLLVVVIVLGSFRSAIADWNDVPSGSMKPTILEGDRVFVNKLAYDLKVPFTTWSMLTWADPLRGDIVVLWSPRDGKRLVKRVVGVPGDVLEVRGQRLVVNGQAAEYVPLANDVLPSSDLRARNPGALLAQETVDGRSHAVMTGSTQGPAASFGPLDVPERCYFVMGDHRDDSLDSRWFGCVERFRIVGRATAVVLSVDLERNFRPRWGRFFTPLV